MADWRMQVTYNNNPSYHAYAFMYQPEPNPSGPDETHSGATQASNAARLGRSSQQRSYPDPGPVYVGGSRAAQHHPLLQAAGPGPHGGAGTEARQTGRDSTGDTEPEAHTSPDSWSSVCSGEGSLPQADSAWAEKEDGLEVTVRSPAGSDDVSSSVAEEPFPVSPTTPRNAPPAASTTPPAAAEPCPKPNVRTVFTRSQMQTLCKRFSEQKYLPPPEMRKLAEETGMTYKQVKTWFQNRRMKFRKCQRDTSWAAERSATFNPASPYPGDGLHNRTTTAAATQNPAHCTGSASFSCWLLSLQQAAEWSANNQLTTFSSNNLQSPNLQTEDEEPVSRQNSSRAQNVNL